MPNTNLNEVIRTTQDAFDKIASGTHTTETYNDNNIYEVELDDPVVLGAEGSHTAINANNELVLDGVAIHATDPTLKEASMVDAELLNIGNNKGLKVEGGELIADVQDVQIKGSSILSSGVANIPMATASSLGVAMFSGTYGVKINGNGQVQTVMAADDEIEGKSSQYKPIVPSNLQVAVDTGVKGSANYQTFAYEDASGNTGTIKMYCEITQN